MIAQAGGLTYNLPQRQFAQQQAQPVMQQQVAQQQQGGSPFDIPMGEDLANVQNLTNNYYTSYGRLKDFTETMWKDYGVDVTKPDFTQPGGGLMHDTFLRMDADLRMAANDLAQQKKRTEEMAKLEAQGKVVRGMLPTGEVYDPTRMLERQFVDAQGRPVSAYVSTDLEDRTLKAIERANEAYYTTGDAAAANAAIKPIKDEYARLIKENPYQAEYYQKQLNAIMDAQSRFSSGMLTGRGGKGGTDDYLTMARTLANQARGNWQTQDTDIDPVTKQVVGVIKPISGLKYGEGIDKNTGKTVDKVIERIVKLPNGEVYAEFVNKGLERERIDNLTSDKFVNTLFMLNPQLGGKSAIEYLNELGIGVTGSWDLPSLYSQREAGMFQQAQQLGQQSKADIEAKLPKLQEIKTNLTGKLEEVVKRAGGGVIGGIIESFRRGPQRQSITSKDLFAGYPSIQQSIPEFKIKKNITNDLFSIDQDVYRQLTNTPTDQRVTTSSYEDLTEEKLIDLLSNFVRLGLSEQPAQSTGSQISNTDW